MDRHEVHSASEGNALKSDSTAFKIDDTLECE